jgi:hypothetical protein
VRDVRAGRGLRGFGIAAQVTPEPLGDKRQAAFRLEFSARLTERVVQLADALAQQRVEQDGLLDRLPDQARGKLREVKVDDPLAETRR